MFKAFSVFLAVHQILSCPGGFLSKLRILISAIRVRQRMVSASGLNEQLAIISAIIKLKAPGVVVECGTYQGASTVGLSLACALTGRKLYIFDSFKGLPEPTEGDRHHAIIRDSQIATYQKGAWLGPFELVRSNIQKYGDLSVCTFVEGYFDSTLPSFKEAVAFAFCDVDLLESLKTCLRYLWPLMSDRAVFFSHEAPHHEIASLFYDRQWWGEIGFQPPGLVGAGNGLGFYLKSDGAFGSDLGYTIKNPTATRQSFELGQNENICREVTQPLMNMNHSDATPR